MEKQAKVSIIIPNYNGKDHLAKCLPSVFGIDYKNYEVIVVDNHSSDDSVDFISKNYPDVVLVRNPRNTGYTGGNNAGYRKARGKYILFLNNDTLVEKDFLSKLVTIFESDPAIGGAQSKILLMDHPNVLDSVGAFLTSSGFLYHYGALKNNSSKYSKKINLYSAKGSCMIFRKDVLDAVKVSNNIFDERYFAYFEETDLCHRVWLAGYRIVFVPESIIYHKVGGTSTKISNSYIQYNSFKNRINSLVKNLGFFNLVRILPLHLLMCEFNAIVFLLKGNLPLFIAIERAIIWNIKDFKRTMRKRKIIQNKIRKVPDDKIFHIISKRVKPSYYVALITDGMRNYKDDIIL